jgi:hypothetical protein
MRYGRDMPRVFSMVPEDFARWVGYPVSDGFAVGQMMRRGFRAAMADLSHVRRFRIEPLEPLRSGRGGGIREIRFVVFIRPVRHDVRTPEIESAGPSAAGLRQRAFVPDAPEFRVKASTWLRLASVFKDVSPYDVHKYSDAWFLALREALRGETWTDGAGLVRRLRGDRLLQALRERPADDVAFDFAVEERQVPDLTAAGIDDWQKWKRLSRELKPAHKDRFRRYTDSRRAAGLAPTIRAEMAKAA